jgi:hypothetical protein
MSDWHNKDRSETDKKRKEKRSFLQNIVVENPALGINIYKNCFPKDFCEYSVLTLERELSGKNKYSWNSAKVTESSGPILEARNCVDFKIGHNCLGPEDVYNKVLYNLHKRTFDYAYPCSQDYGQYWGVGVQYFEVFNFVKYEGEGTHFNIHSDHGPAYVCTVSMVGYLNDDYEGGELYFPRFDLKIKPEAGDLFIFPSTYIYEHASLPIKSGNKYSIVVMTDYNDRGNLRYYDYTNNKNELIY